MDNELKSLCEEVYEKLHWQVTEWVYCHGRRVLAAAIKFDTSDMHPHIPEYTSDYLFEQIERRIGKDKVLHVYSMFDVDTYEKYCKANVGTPGTIEIQTDRTDTPRKALLKLVLALHEAGELNHE